MGRVNQWLVEQGEQPEWDWTKLEPQRQFLTSQSPFTMYSGGFYAGKTAALCGKIIILMTMIPNNLGYLARQDGKALKQTTMVSFLEMVPKAWIVQHDSQKGILRFSPEVGGSMLIYGDLKDTGDLKNHNLGFFAMDQAEETSWESWEFLAGRLRRKLPIVDPNTMQRQYWVVGNCEKTGQRHLAIGHSSEACALCQQKIMPFSEEVDQETKLRNWEVLVYPRFGFGVCNTEDPNHWIFKKFSGLPGQDEQYSEGIPGYQAYHASTYDSLNAGIADKSYVDQLEQTYGLNSLMHDRYLLGKWVVAEGLIFPEFNKTTHVIHEDQVRYDGTKLLDEWLPVHEYIDPGLTAPTAVGWVVIEHCLCGCGKPNYYVIDEHYVSSKVPEYHCDQIKQHRQELGRHVISTEMDSQAFYATNVQTVTAANESRIYSLSQLYIEQGIYVRRNQKDWDGGSMRLSAAMMPDSNHTHPITGEKGAPHFFVFSRCKWFLYEITNYKWKKRKNTHETTEEPSDHDDHHMDGIISFMAGRPEHRVVPPPEADTRSEFQKTIEDELEELTGAGAGAQDFMEW